MTCLGSSSSKPLKFHAELISVIVNYTQKILLLLTNCAIRYISILIEFRNLKGVNRCYGLGFMNFLSLKGFMNLFELGSVKLFLRWQVGPIGQREKERKGLCLSAKEGILIWLICAIKRSNAYLIQSIFSSLIRIFQVNIQTFSTQN